MRTYYLREDGKIDFILLLDNVHSTAKKTEAAAEEKKWLQDFKKGDLFELKALKEAHARGVSTRLLRSEPPYSALLLGKLASARDLGIQLGLTDPEPANRIAFAKDGKKQSLTIHAAKPKEPRAQPATPPSSEEADAPNRVFWRFVPVGGKITSAKTCIVTEDKSSCLLDVAEIFRQDHKSGVIDIVVTWELD